MTVVHCKPSYFCIFKR